MARIITIEEVDVHHSVVTDGDVKFFTRHETPYDMEVIRENAYKRLLHNGHLSGEDIWLDAGANIGTFTARFANYVDAIVAIECDPDNVVALRRTVELNGHTNVTTIEGALVHSGLAKAKTVTMQRTKASSRNRISDKAIRGREAVQVRAYSLPKLIDDFALTCLKLDIEGSEKDILLDPELDLKRLRQLIFEYHFREIPDMDQTHYAAVHARLISEGFVVDAPTPHTKEGKRWYALVHAIRA